MNKPDYFVHYPKAGAALIGACRSWKGTPFRKDSCVKGIFGGVDCKEYVAAVFQEIGAIPSRPVVPSYDINHAEHSDDSVLKAWFDSPEVRLRVRPLDEEEMPLIGDMVFPEVCRAEHHLALWLVQEIAHVARPSGVTFHTISQLRLHHLRYRLTV